MLFSYDTIILYSNILRGDFLKKDICIFDHLRLFLIATAAPFFLLFLLTNFILGIYSFLLMGLIGMVTTAALLAISYFEWGRDSLPRHRLGKRELSLGFLICGGIYFAFNVAAWVLTFIVKFHWNFNTVYMVALAFWPMAQMLGIAGIDRSFFADERVIPSYVFPCFVLFCAVYCVILSLTALVAYRAGVRADEKEQAMVARGEKIVKKSFAKKIIFVPILNLVPFFTWILRHMVHMEAKLRELILPLLVILISGLGYRTLVLIADVYLQSIFWYFALRLIGLYLLGIFVSYVEICDGKKYEFLD